MCFPKADQPYNAYRAKDFYRWEELYAKWEAGQATGVDPLTAEEHAELGNLENKIKADPAAGLESRERRRQTEVTAGKKNIDTAYNQFNDDYYKNYEQDYTGYYNPQLDQQFGDANAKLAAALTGRGIKNSTVGIDAVGDLTEENLRARTGIANEAVDARNKLRSTVEGSKSNLYALNESSADAQGINARAIGEATALVAPPAFNPLGKVFADALAPWGNYMQARQNRPPPDYTSPVYNPSGGGSGRVVNSR